MKKGDTIMKLDLEYLKQNAPSVASPVICTELADNQKIRLVAEGKKMQAKSYLQLIFMSKIRMY